MKKMLGVSIALSLTLVLMIMSCASPTDDLAGSLNQADARFVVPEKSLIVTIEQKDNLDRKNASGPKIPSNAHSGDFEGIYFYWNNKQKDDAVLFVNADVFLMAESFVLTTKESNKYYDYLIEVKENQIPVDIADGLYYVFAINKTGGKNINMVFIPEVIIIGTESNVNTAYDYISEDGKDENGKAYINYKYFAIVQKEVKGKTFDFWKADADSFSFSINDGEKGSLDGDTVTIAVDGDDSYYVAETISLMTNKYVVQEPQAAKANFKEGSISFNKTIELGDYKSIAYTVEFFVDGDNITSVIDSNAEAVIGEVVSGANTLVFTATDDLTVSIQISFESAYGEVNTFTNYLNGFGNGGGNKGTATNVSGKTLFHDGNTKTYATLNKADLEAGFVTLNVYGDNANLPYVGKAFVELVNGQLVITLDGENVSIKAARATYDSNAISSLHKDDNNGGSFKNGHVIDIDDGTTSGDTIYLYVWGEANFYKSSEK